MPDQGLTSDFAREGLGEVSSTEPCPSPGKSEVKAAFARLNLRFPLGVSGAVPIELANFTSCRVE